MSVQAKLRPARLWPGLLLALTLSPGCAEESSLQPPQIVPQQSPYNLGPVPILGATPEVEAALAQPRTFTLQLSDGGDQTLVIRSARLLGDLRCSFSQPAIVRAEARPHGVSAVLLLGYRPASPGDDDVMLEVSSNAERFPVLNVPVCGSAYDPASAERPAPRPCGTPTLELNEACDLTPEGSQPGPEADAGLPDASSSPDASAE